MGKIKENYLREAILEYKKRLSKYTKLEIIELEDESKKGISTKKRKVQQVKAKLNFVITTYYKGTGMEEVLKKLEQYLDSCDKNENSITSI